MNLNELAKTAHANAVERGFWQENHSNEHCLMLVITEIAEMIEADRKDKNASIGSFNFWLDTTDSAFDHVFESCIKDTVEDEFADIAIRLADLAGALEIDFDRLPVRLCNRHQYDSCSFTETAFALTGIFNNGLDNVASVIQLAFDFLETWAKHIDIDLEWHIEKKMMYNQLRSAMHGKKY